MSRKKNLLDYLALTLFIMCMGLALSASLEYVTRATEREYLGQGIWVLSMAGLSLLALLLGRISRKCGQKMQPLPFSPLSEFESIYSMRHGAKIEFT